MFRRRGIAAACAALCSLAIAPGLAETVLAAAAQSIPAEWTQRYESLYSALRPSVRTWVDQQGLRAAQAKTLDPNSLRAMILNRFPQLAPSNPDSQLDIQALVFLVMMQAAGDANQDLRATAAHVQAIAEAKQRVRRLIAETKQEIATAPAIGSPSTPCGSAFCRSLGARLADLSAATAGLRHPVRVVTPPQPSYADLALLQGHLQEADGALSDLSTEEQTQLQEDQSRISQLYGVLSNVMTAVRDTDQSILSNLR
jgi:hypothetical protein